MPELVNNNTLGRQLFLLSCQRCPRQTQTARVPTHEPPPSVLAVRSTTLVGEYLLASTYSDQIMRPVSGPFLVHSLTLVL